MLLAVFLAMAFIVSVVIWYMPILFKGYPSEITQSAQTDLIILGRNFAQTGVLGTENKLNVVLSPQDVASQAVPSSIGNKFTAYSYSVIFKLFGWQSWENIILITILLYALGAVFFTLTVWHLFGLRAAMIFPLVYALLPFNGQAAQTPGFYEFALLYFAIFTFFYFVGRDRKYKIFYFILAGIFLALSCMSREAMFVFLPIFFFWLLYQRKRKELLAIFIPVGLLLTIFWLPSFFGIGSSNDYLKLFASGNKNDFQWSFFVEAIGNIDPYTLHFDQGSVAQRLEQLKKDLSDKNSSFFYKTGEGLKLAKGLGFKQFNIFDYFVAGTNNLAAHLSKFLAIEYIGGPIIFLLMLFGFWQLKRQKKELYYFFVVWLGATVLILSYALLVIRNHLMDFGWAVAALAALGLAGFFPLLQNYFQAGRYSKFIFFCVVSLVLYSLVLADHVYLGRGYDNNANPAIKYLAQKVNEKSANIAGGDVIAVGDIKLHPFLNYLTGKSVVFFLPSTIDKLIKEQKLQEGFDRFDVKYVVGFSQDLSDSITKNSDAINIAVWPKTDELAGQVSYNKMWLLNIIK